MGNEISEDHKEKVWKFIFKVPDWIIKEYELKKLRKKSNINQKNIRGLNHEKHI